MKNKVNLILISLICSIASYVAIFLNSNLVEELLGVVHIRYIASKLGLTSVFGIIVIILLFIIFYFFGRKEKPDATVAISSIIFSIVNYCGLMYEKFGTIFQKDLFFVLILAYLLGWFLIFVNVIYYFKLFLIKVYNSKSFNFLNKLSNKKFIIICVLIMVICWSPYIILRYPAGIESDAKNQIAMILGFQKLTNRWPVFSSVLMGSFFKFGKAIFNSYDIGAFLLVIFQTLVSAITLTYSLLFIRKKGGSNLSLILILFIYSFVPLFPGYITSIVKDALFADCVVAFTILFIEIFDGSVSIKKKMFFIIIGLLMCLLRNNGIYIVLFLLIALFIVSIIKKQNYKFIIVSLSLIFAFNIGYNKILIPTLDLYCDNTVEALSIPLQQTARCLKYHYNDIGDEDLKIIDNTIDIDDAIERYNPLLSDPVKESYHANTKDLLEYFKVWLKMFFDYPLTYIDSTLNNIYGFFYPKASLWNRPKCGFYTSNDIAGNELLSKNDTLSVLANQFEDNYIDLLENNIITFLPCSVGFWICISLILSIWSINKRKLKFFIYNIPNLVGVLVLIASPTFAQNGFRYALPVVYLMPLFLWLFINEIMN